MDSTGLSIILLICVILSGVFSASETAFTSLNRIKIKKKAEDGDRRAKKALLIFDNYDIAITTILICNNIVNIASASIGTLLVIDLFPELQAYVAIVSTLSVTVVILIFGEVMPKNYAKTQAESFALFISSILYVLIKLLKPFSYPLIMINNFVRKSYKNNNADEKSVTEDELKAYIDSVEEEGIIEEEEGNLVKSVLDFDDTSIGDILTPRTDIVGVSVDIEEEDLFELIYSEKFSRLPLYDESLDNIIGLIYERDILIKKSKDSYIDLCEIMREAHFVPKSMKASSLLKYLQEKNAHMAIVIDEFGGTCGLITMEDLLEEIVGDIYDEHDEVIERVVEKDGYYIVSHDEPISDFFEEYLEDDGEPETEYSGVGGFVYELLEVLPYVGAEVEYETDKHTITFRVIEVESNRIEKMKVSVVEKEQVADKITI